MIRTWLFAVAATLAAFMFAGAAQAQAFDCHAAKSWTERLICADKPLAKLDGELDTAYRRALDLAVDAAALRRDQRAWLKQRDACRDAACVRPLYAARLKVLATTPRPPSKANRLPGGVATIDVPMNDTVTPCTDMPAEYRSRCIEIHGRNFGAREMLVRLRVFDLPLERVAQDEAGFERKDGRWMTTYGRFEPVPVETFAGVGWTGMRATVICGTSDPETGFHAAGGECLWEVLSDGRHTILATTDGYGEPEEVTKPLLATVRFAH
jgi:uncharacterized protein